MFINKLENNVNKTQGAKTPNTKIDGILSHRNRRIVQLWKNLCATLHF